MGTACSSSTSESRYGVERSIVGYKGTAVTSNERIAWRILNPDLYLDVMQRIKALGFNAISMYTFWGLHNPSPGVLDFEGWKHLGPFFEAANQAGLWVVARPGPYIVSS